MFDCYPWCHSLLQPSLPDWFLHSRPFCWQVSREIAHWILLTTYAGLYITQNSKTKLSLQTQLFFSDPPAILCHRGKFRLYTRTDPMRNQIREPSLLNQLKPNLIQSKTAKLKASASVQWTPLFLSDDAQRSLAAGYRSFGAFHQSDI